MAIKDIRFMNGEGYLLKDIMLSLTECEKQMRTIEYERYYDVLRTHRDDAGVEKTQFPSFVYAFYNYVFSQWVIPTPIKFLNEYYSLNCDELFVNAGMVTYQDSTYEKLDLDARILRTYPSLIRDFHFYLMLIEARCFDKVIYSCQKDIEGKDLLIKHNGKEYVVSLFVQTKRASFFKKVKNAFRHQYGANEIQIPLDLSTANKCGEFFIYSSEDVEKIRSIIIDE